MTIEQAIRRAEKLLPGIKAPEGESDPRWQAIIKVSMFIESNPEEVWTFISKWGRSDEAVVVEDYADFAKRPAVLVLQVAESANRSTSCGESRRGTRVQP